MRPEACGARAKGCRERGGGEGFSPLRPPAGMLRCQCLEFRTSGRWNCRRICVLCSESLSAWLFVTAAGGKLMQPDPLQVGDAAGPGRSLGQWGGGRRGGMTVDA